jgi:hypothetical protein
MQEDEISSATFSVKLGNQKIPGLDSDELFSCYGRRESRLVAVLRTNINKY